MREIKFRAWDKELEKMHYDIEYIYDDVGTSCASFGDMLEDTERFNVMQYTGLKDKDGKEIYEGDIVHFKTLRSKEYIGEVKSYEDAASFFVVAKEHYMECLDDVYDLEVLGNIYENKELLDE